MKGFFNRIFKRKAMRVSLVERKKQLKHENKNSLIRMLLINEAILGMIMDEYKIKDLRAYRKRVLIP